MSFVLDTGVMPSGVTHNIQLNNWSNEKSDINYAVRDTMVQSVMRYNQLFTVEN